MMTQTIYGIGDGGYYTTGNLAWADVLVSGFYSGSGSYTSTNNMGFLTNGGSGTYGMAYVAGTSANSGLPCLGEVGFIDRYSSAGDKRAAVIASYYDTSRGYSIRYYVRNGLTGSMSTFTLGATLDNAGTLNALGLTVNSSFNTVVRALSGIWTMNGSGLVVQNSSPFFSNVSANSMSASSISATSSMSTQNLTATAVVTASSFASRIVRAYSHYTLTQNDSTVIFSGSSLITGTLPSASTASGKRYSLKNIGGVMVTIVPPSGAKIDGANSYVLSGGSMKPVTVQSDGSWYWIVG